MKVGRRGKGWGRLLIRGEKAETGGLAPCLLSEVVITGWGERRDGPRRKNGMDSRGGGGGTTERKGGSVVKETVILRKIKRVGRRDQFGKAFSPGQGKKRGNWLKTDNFGRRSALISDRSRRSGKAVSEAGFFRRREGKRETIRKG